MSTEAGPSSSGAALVRASWVLVLATALVLAPLALASWRLTGRPINPATARTIAHGWWTWLPYLLLAPGLVAAATAPVLAAARAGAALSPARALIAAGRGLVLAIVPALAVLATVLLTLPAAGVPGLMVAGLFVLAPLAGADHGGRPLPAIADSVARTRARPWVAIALGAGIVLATVLVAALLARWSVPALIKKPKPAALAYVGNLTWLRLGLAAAITMVGAGALAAVAARWPRQAPAA